MSSTLAPAERQAIALRFVEIAIAAGAAILAVGATGRRLKADESPVTAADEAAEAVILDALASRFPDWPVVSEEAACANGAPRDVGATYILVDPLDGTREFLAGNGQYTVNVALVEGGRPTVGAHYAPAPGRLWFAGAGAPAARMRDGRALGARPIRARPVPSEGAIALASRSHLDPATGAFLEALAPAKRMQAG
ncbi:MAG: 3'(2'),5'-bisphosphate nucleotidase CysQ, partial [Hyphomicrobiales bacterium]|nr:3'(2'),5'-bisphosphate nucleotidase CysQ [Hyphomicrobiales bacterium]